MATIYCRADGDNTTGATWATAKTTLAAAVTAAGAGGLIYLADGYAENTAASITIDCALGTPASPIRILTVDDTGNPEPPTALATGATCKTSTSGSMNIFGVLYSYGCTYGSGNGGSGSTQDITIGDTNKQTWVVIENGGLTLGSSNNTPKIIVGPVISNTSDDIRCELINSPISFAGTGHSIVTRMPFRWRNTPNAFSGTAPNSLFLAKTGGFSEVIVENCDLSGVGAKPLVDIAAGQPGRYTFERCKLHASATRTTGTAVGQAAVDVYLINCDNSVNYKHSYDAPYQGAVTTDITTYLTATDGTTPFSHKMVSSAGAQAVSPLRGFEIAKWNETTGSAVTVKINVVTDGVTLTDAEAWIDVSYLGDSASPLGTSATDRVSDPVFGTSANQTTNSAAWTGAPGSPVKQELSKSVTPQKKGLIKARVLLAKASTTLYYDPILVIS